MDPYAQWEGQIVPRTFSSGFVVLSYIISYIGSWTTLELLDKRTAGRGRHNWLLLIASSFTMGAIAIWSTHFIGNKGVVLGNGAPQLQLAYNSGLTVASFFVPTVVLLAAFFGIGSNEKVRQLRVILGGMLAGFAISGMYYIGQTGIANYECIYEFQNIVGSIIIAVIASVIALWVFFVLRAGWTNSWWKRGLCAVLLAGAVSGMHWLASSGTQYRYKNSAATRAAGLTTNQSVTIVIVFAVGGCIILLCLALLTQRRRHQYATRCQQIVLACATFDAQGKILVTSEGLLPSQKITNTYVEKSSDDIFNISHPVFLWMFRTTRNWRGITDLIPGMRTHLQSTSKNGSKSDGMDRSNEDQGPEDYSVTFREMFCVAASELADQISEPVENVGVLYDEIIATGVTNKQKRTVDKGLFRSHDLEHNGPTPFVFGRGQVLFVVRRTNKAESARLQASGFRFAGTQNIVDILARSMQVHREPLVTHLESMQRYSRGDHILNPGVHLACFAIRASVRGGFDVLVRKDAKNQLPTMQLPVGSLEPWHRTLLAQLEGWTVTACLKHLHTKSTASDSESIFTAQLADTIEALADEIGESFFNDAQLVTRAIYAPCRGFGDYPLPGKAALLAFRIIVPIHLRTQNNRLTYSPLSFFRTQQHVYRNMTDHDVFARQIHREFSPILGTPLTLTNPSIVQKPLRAATAYSIRSGRSVRSESPPLSEKNYFSAPSSPTPSQSHAAQFSSLTQQQHTNPPSLLAPPTLLGRDGARSRSYNNTFSVSQPGTPTRPRLPNSKSWFGFSTDSPLRFGGNSFRREGRARSVTSDGGSEKGLVSDGGHVSPLGGIMVSQEVSVDVREVGRDNGMGGTGEVEMKKMPMGTVGSAETEVDDKETFVDLLFSEAVEGR